jgi:hypothetical protein
MDFLVATILSTSVVLDVVALKQRRAQASVASCRRGKRNRTGGQDISSDDSSSSSSSSSSCSSTRRVAQHRDSLDLMKFKARQAVAVVKSSAKLLYSSSFSQDEDDDEADLVSVTSCSMTSLDSDSDCDLAVRRTRSVSFCSPLVTQVHTRPRTSRLDKRSLYYCELDYRIFRYESLYGVNAPVSPTRATSLMSSAAPLCAAPMDCPKSSKKSLSFCHRVVVHRYTTPPVDPSILYYSDVDVQRLLSDFLQSLKQSKQVVQ